MIFQLDVTNATSSGDWLSRHEHMHPPSPIPNVTTSMYRTLALLLTVAAITGCGTKPQVALPKPLIKTIAIAPATSPTSYTFQNLSAIQFVVPIAAAGYALDSKSKATTFNQLVLAKSPQLGQSLTDTVAKELEAYGYKVRVMDNLTRKPDDPDNIDYEKLEFVEDALVHLTLSEVGLVSPRSTTSYLTRVNGSGVVFVKGREDYLFDQSIYYGLDAKEGKDWAIAADETGAYSGFDEIQANVDTVIARFDTGTRMIGKRLAAQIHAAIR